MAVLPSLVHRARKRDKKLFSDPAIAEALESKLRVTSGLPIPDAAAVAALQGVTGLDAGEVVLIDCIAANRSSLLLTGDKRALRALAATELPSVVPPLAGRVLCLEHVIAYALIWLDPVKRPATPVVRWHVVGFLLQPDKERGAGR